MEIKDSKILVIGGAGFIGSFVVTELLKHQLKRLSFMIILHVEIKNILKTIKRRTL